MEREEPGPSSLVTIELDRTIFSPDAVLKTCHWFSKDFAFEISPGDGASVSVSLTPKQPCVTPGSVRADFFSMATDFTLRERVEVRTSSIRELLLAKAFAEAGVLEDSPEGVFGDAIEERKPDGLFKILSNP